MDKKWKLLHYFGLRVQGLGLGRHRDLVISKWVNGGDKWSYYMGYRGCCISYPLSLPDPPSKRHSPTNNHSPNI